MRQFSQRFMSHALAIALALMCAREDVRAQESDIPSPTSFVNEQVIDQMADAYIAIRAIQAKANAELNKADDQAHARQVIEHAQSAIIRAVERTGLEVRQFNRLSELAALDPALSARIRMRVLERQPI